MDGPIIRTDAAVVFGKEYDDLPVSRRRLVDADYQAAWREDNVFPEEYMRRIGRGNLRAYSDCLAAQARGR